MAHRIVFLDRSTLIADIRSPKFVHEWAEYPASTPDEIIERLRDATIAISNKATLSAKYWSSFPDSKWWPLPPPAPTTSMSRNAMHSGSPFVIFETTHDMRLPSTYLRSS